MTLTLLGTAVGAGLLSTFIPRSPLHWLLGLVSLGALIATLVKLPSGEGENWFILMATLIAVAANAFGLLMLLARRHPRRIHRHIIYCGFGLVFAVIGLLWALVVRYPGPRHDLWAAIGSGVTYIVGSVFILIYKARKTGALL
jgi:predicted membrane channel-forming protein YqfA (hemolysin III family)